MGNQLTGYCDSGEAQDHSCLMTLTPRLLTGRQARLAMLLGGGSGGLICTRMYVAVQK